MIKIRKFLVNGDLSMLLPDFIRYVQKVKCLNESLVRWIDQHVRSSPCCILSPVFRDYERHLDKLNNTFNVTPDRLTGTAVASTSTDTTTIGSTGKFLIRCIG